MQWIWKWLHNTSIYWSLYNLQVLSSIYQVILDGNFSPVETKTLGILFPLFFPFEAPFTCSICSNILDYKNYGGLRNFWSTPGWFLFPFLVFCLFPIGSMYGIYLHYIYHKKSTEYIGILNIYIPYMDPMDLWASVSGSHVRAKEEKLPRCRLLMWRCRAHTCGAKGSWDPGLWWSQKWLGSFSSPFYHLKQPGTLFFMAHFQKADPPTKT